MYPKATGPSLLTGASGYRLEVGDCLALLRALPDNCVDAIVTDPPYGLTNDSGGPHGKGQNTAFSRSRAGAGRGGFMGLKWDAAVPGVEVWAECLRVLKPGGHLLAFASTRTQHRMCTRIEDAGFEIRDMIAWMYGSGFPKSRNGIWGGTALKPAIEPITLARKPLIGGLQANALAFGTGGLNIEACRVAPTTGSMVRYGEASQDCRYEETRNSAFAMKPGVRNSAEDGRWPANLIHDGSVEALSRFPESVGQKGRLSGHSSGRRTKHVYGAMGAPRYCEPRSDVISAAQFFYCPKTSRIDRHEGVGDPPPVFKHGATLRQIENATNDRERPGNGHPTVKPTDLMRYLCRLITPEGGLVLDPFMGSGSTGKAAILEGFEFLGFDLDPEYVEIAKHRIDFATGLRRREQEARDRQLSLFEQPSSLSHAI